MVSGAEYGVVFLCEKGVELLDEVTRESNWKEIGTYSFGRRNREEIVRCART